MVMTAISLAEESGIVKSFLSPLGVSRRIFSHSIPESLTIALDLNILGQS
jgi:hypothetical protein